MKSATQMSMEIRKKKKAMQDQHDVVDLSGIPEDKTDLDIAEQEELTTELGMDTNKPKEHNTDPYSHQALMKDSHDAAHEAKAPDLMPNEAEHAEVDSAASKRKARLSKMMGR